MKAPESMRSSVVSLLAGMQPDRTPIWALPVSLGGELPGMHCSCPVAQFCGDQVQIRVLANRDAVDEWLTAMICPDQVEHRFVFWYRGTVLVGSRYQTSNHLR